MLAAGPVPCNVGIAAPVPMPPAGTLDPEVAGAGAAGVAGDSDGGAIDGAARVDPAPGAGGAFAADAPSVLAAPLGNSGIGRRAGVGVSAGGAVGWGEKPPWGAA